MVLLGLRYRLLKCSNKWCSQIFSGKEFNETKLDEFECRLCNSKFPKSKFDEHLRINHFQCTYIECNNQTFTSSSELNNHQAVAHCEYKCEDCDKELNTLSLYLRHVNWHTLLCTNSALTSATTVAKHANASQWHVCDFPDCAFAFKLRKSTSKILTATRLIPNISQISRKVLVRLKTLKSIVNTFSTAHVHKESANEEIILV